MSSNEVDAQKSKNEIRSREIIMVHITRYPKMKVQDLYKLIHQGVMGSEHALEDVDVARKWLEDEINNLASGPDEPVVDPISMGGEIVRINLRPYIQSGGNSQALLKAFLRTANEYRGSMEDLLRCWSYAENMSHKGGLKFSQDELSNYFTEMRENAFPAVHHSKIYEESYQPAYRVVAYSILTGWKQVRA